MIRLLRADEIECRAQSVKSNGCVLLLYKDARTDMNLLDETFGNANWQRTHEVINDNLFCNLDIWDMDKKCWVRKQDVGVESNTEKEKGQASDAFKRAGFNVGIGRELYTAPFIWINLTADEVDNSRGKPSLSFKVKFHVSKIGYNDKREIIKLEIKDRAGKVRYTLGAEQPKPKTVKAPSKSEIETDMKQAKEAIEKCKSAEDLMVVWNTFKSLQGVAEFKKYLVMQKRNLELNDSGVVFIENPRGYWIGETHLEGLTGMIGRQLFPNKYAAVPEKILAKAAERGHRIHEEIQVYDMFGEIASEEVRWYADMKKDEKFDVIDSEYLVTDGTHFASAIDKVLVKDGKVCLADVKTTYELDKTYISWQLSIYKYLFNLLNPDIDVDKLYAIWVRNGASLHEVPEIPQEEVIELLNCERQGTQYIRKDVATVEDEKAIEVVRQMSDVLVEIAELEAKRDAFKKQLEEMFEQFGVEKWETDHFNITRVGSYIKETFDSKKFKADNPELAKDYVKQTEVKPSIRIKLK